MTCKTSDSRQSEKTKILPHARIAWRLINLSDQRASALWDLYEKEILEVHHSEEIVRMALKKDVYDENG